MKIELFDSTWTVVWTIIVRTTVRFQSEERYLRQKKEILNGSSFSNYEIYVNGERIQ